MKGEDISELRGELQAVRGETRVKQKEESIRNRFLQAACDEIFVDHDWPFNHKSVSVSTLVAEVADDLVSLTGRFEAPANFSMFNDYYVGNRTGTEKQINASEIVVEQEEGKIYLTFPTTAKYDFQYYITAPNIQDDSTAKVYFPQHILIAERAYVRLKTAYFPDEESDKELTRSKRALRELFVKSVPKQNFTTNRWG